MKVSEVMTANVISVLDSSSIEDTARVLARHQISGVPVISRSGALMGLVTEYD